MRGKEGGVRRGEKGGEIKGTDKWGKGERRSRGNTITQYNNVTREHDPTPRPFVCTA